MMTRPRRAPTSGALLAWGLVLYVYAAAATCAISSTASSVRQFSFRQCLLAALVPWALGCAAGWAGESVRGPRSRARYGWAFAAATVWLLTMTYASRI